MYNLIPLEIKLFVQIKFIYHFFPRLKFAEIAKQITTIIFVRKFFIKKGFLSIFKYELHHKHCEEIEEGTFGEHKKEEHQGLIISLQKGGRGIRVLVGIDKFE